MLDNYCEPETEGGTGQGDPPTDPDKGKDGE